MKKTVCKHCGGEVQPKRVFCKHCGGQVSKLRVSARVKDKGRADSDSNDPE